MMDAEALIKEILGKEKAQNDSPNLCAFQPISGADAGNDDDELLEMKGWIRSLTREELLGAMAFTFHRDDDCGAGGEAGACGSHEYDLLKQMLAAQSPPPTPIHPRAVPYRPATRRGATDGRDEEERVRRNRRDAPRFFQFLERKDLGGRSLQEVDLSSSLYSRNKHGVMRRSRRRSGQHQAALRFDVFARKFVTTWGETLTVGTTEDQREADNLVLTVAKVKSTQMGVTPSQALFHWPRRMNKETILTQLRIASRGNFLSMSPACATERCGEKVDKLPHLSFCAPWLDPTVRWFSLPMYLTSRIEVSLWEAFRKKPREPALDDSAAKKSLGSIEQMAQNVSDNILLRSLQKAVCKAVAKNVLCEEDVYSGHILDSALWQLLSSPNQLHPLLTLQKRFNVVSICTIPMVELGSVSDTFRLATLRYLHDDLARQTETKLLEKSEAEMKCPETRNAPAGARSSKKKNKRKKRRKKHRAENASGESKGLEGVSPTESHKSNKESSSADLENDKESHSSSLVNESSTPCPSRERNRSTIIALLIIEDVIGAVFCKVGLGSENDTLKMIEVTKKRGTHHGAEHRKKEQSNRPTALRKSPAPQAASYQPTKKLPPRIPPRKVLPPKRGQTKDKQTYAKVASGAISDASNQNAKTDDPSFSTLSLNSFQHQQQSHHQQVFSFMHPNNGLPQHNIDCNSPSPFFDVIGMSLNFGGALNEWGGMKKYQSREKSLFAEFFNTDSVQKDVEEILMTASTAASIASSSGDEVQYDIQQVDEDVENEKAVRIEDDCKSNPDSDDDKSYVKSNVSEPKSPTPVSSLGVAVARDCSILSSNNQNDIPSVLQPPIEAENDPSPVESTTQSPSPSEPPTPPPQLSPIQVSLADIGKLSKHKTEELRKEFERAACTSPVQVAGRSLPSSPKFDQSKRTWSREDLRTPSFNDDQMLRRKPRGLPRHTILPAPADVSSLSYRNAVLAKSFRKASSTCSHDGKSGESVASTLTGRHRPSVDATKAGLAVPLLNSPSKESVIGGDLHMNACAQSETALEGHEESSHWNVTPRASHHDEADNATTTRDGATTISSGHSPQQDTDEITLLREERNAFRDLCLTLGAEVAKLKNQVACNSFYPAVPYAPSSIQQPFYYGASSSYDPEFMPSFFHGMQNGSNRTLGAMSDAGVLHQDVAISEDGTADIAQGPLNTAENAGIPWSCCPNSISHVRQTSTGGTKTGSDACSTEYGPCCHGSVAFSGFRSTHRDNLMSVPSHGLLSRLSQDIESFLRATTAQLKKQESRRSAATKRLSRLVTALWPRAQVKLYGSHVSNLCLPSSDIDYVICLPAVHKKDIAVAPGVLEGRNAINETSQKMLARRLKGESWIDPRSIKLIDRTVIPVIKVSTKDCRARVLHLDISFDGPGHRGLDAVQMVTDVMEELPMVRPLVLVLKQFLLDRGLLTAYSGGLSSYCLFLMVTRYLQEQPSAWNDCGSLLMGFLDFYGNSFDPRSTGISVRRKQYFSRPYYAQQAAAHSHQMWNISHQQQTIPNPVSPMGVESDFPDLSRRHSFTEAARGAGAGAASAVMNSSPAKHGMKPPRFQPKRTLSQHSLNQQISQHAQPHQGPPLMPAGRPYTFDPLFVEDPLNSGNNIGRNSFRIFQVKRAFSDAHRALVASLEWDMNSTGGLNDGSDYPLLKCLLHSEDTFFDIPDNRP